MRSKWKRHCVKVFSYCMGGFFAVALSNHELIQAGFFFLMLFFNVNTLEGWEEDKQKKELEK